MTFEDTMSESEMRRRSIKTEEQGKLRDLEQLCVDFIRRLERGDEYDAQVDMIRTWICDRHPDVAGGGE